MSGGSAKVSTDNPATEEISNQVGTLDKQRKACKYLGYRVDGPKPDKDPNDFSIICRQPEGKFFCHHKLEYMPCPLKLPPV
ncbi:MAG: hypothetical protein ABIH76_07280 [Candidatus Bathyarchaeota archaeon]